MVFLLANRQHSALEWKGLFEGLYDIDEHLPVFRIFGSVAGEMNINASPAELRIEVSECKQLVGSKQNVYGLRLVGDGLDYVQLIEEAAARRNLAEMLGLIDHHRHRLAIPDGLFYGKAVFSTGCPIHENNDRPRHAEPDHPRQTACQIVIGQHSVALWVAHQLRNIFLAVIGQHYSRLRAAANLGDVSD